MEELDKVLNVLSIKPVSKLINTVTETVTTRANAYDRITMG